MACYRALVSEQRGAPLPEIHGDLLVQNALREIEEEEALSYAIGVDLTPAAPDPAHAPLIYAPLDVWLRRSEEIHRFREGSLASRSRGASTDSGL